MKKIFENLLKHNKIIYLLYSRLMSFFLNLLKIFVHIDDNIILFNSFGGKKYDDSPKAIFEYMVNEPKYKKFKIYWGINEPEKYNIQGAEVIKNNSFKYFLIALKAKYWITNSSIERGLKFKNKKTIYISTWHGTPIKKIGYDMQEDDGSNFRVSDPDCYFAQSEYDRDIFARAFHFPKDKIFLTGMPRNDSLTKFNSQDIVDIKNKLGIPLDKKVILYGPTYREYERDKFGCVLKPPINLDKWRKELSKDYCVLFRAHYEVNKSLDIKDDEFIKNMSSYDYLNELLVITDILVSDYSGIMVDYSILERPIYCFAYDYETYSARRGLYIDLNEELPNKIIKDEDILIKEIKNCDYELQASKTRKFKEKYVQIYGEASKYIDNIILKQ